MYLSIRLADVKKVPYVIPAYFKKDFEDPEWSFGTAKLVSLNGIWYLHIPMTKTIPDMFDASKPKHVVGIDRGLSLMITTYDKRGDVQFVSGEEIMKRRDKFNAVRAELQSKGTKTAKRV